MKTMSGWQPIGSAPKDGTEILLSDGRWVAAGWWAAGGHSSTGDWYEVNTDPTDSFGGPLLPTHWQPFPEPPEKQ